MKKVTKVDYQFYKVIGNGAVSITSLGEGRFIPAIIIDIEENIAITDLMKLHMKDVSGDTQLSWSRPPSLFSTKTLGLNLEFLRPMKIEFGIEFNLSNQFSLIDGIIQSRALFLLSGKIGDKVSELLPHGIAVEVPDLKFDAEWDKMLFETITKKYKKTGVSRNAAKAITKEHIQSMRDIWNMRRE